MAEDPSISNNQQQVSLKEPFSVKWTDKFQVIIFTGIFVAAIGAGLQLFKSALVGTLASSDDAPILMAGGSFYMNAAGIGHFNRDAVNHKLVHAENGSRKLRVYAVDVIDHDGKLSQVKDIPPNASGEMIFTYCSDSACSGQSDTITLAFNNSGADNVSIVNTNHDIDTSAENSGVLSHPQTGWFLNRVNFRNWNAATAPPDATCGDHSHCTVLIRTCLPRGCQ
jgi:hypothetical protein